MFLKLDSPLVVFDLETTGINPRNDRIVEFAAIKVLPDGSEESLTLRINPEQPIPAEATAIHGISDADVAEAPTFRKAARQVLDFLSGCDLSGFNIIRFDVPLLCQEFRRVNIEFDISKIRMIDAQRIYHMREPRTLAAALNFYCGQSHDNAHSAEADTRATLNVLEAQLQKYSDLPRDVSELDAICNPRDPEALDNEGKLKWRDNEVIIAFGQKNGIPLRKMANTEPGYLRWMLNKDFSPEVKAIVRDALEGKFPRRADG